MLSSDSKMASDRSHSLQHTGSQCRRRGKQDWRAWLELVCTFVAVLQPLARADDFAVTRPGEAPCGGPGDACKHAMSRAQAVCRSPANVDGPGFPILGPPAAPPTCNLQQTPTCKGKSQKAAPTNLPSAICYPALEPDPRAGGTLRR